jgi:amidase
MDPSILALDGLGQAEKVRRGEIRATELVELSIDRIERINPVLNCVVVERFEQALIEARRIDAGPDGNAPFRGVPALLKDLGQQIEGLPQTNGSRAPLMAAPARDSAIAASYRRAGMVLLGKTSSPEFGNHSTTEPAAHGPCRNPWDTGRTAGGSSGGSGAAVAARMVAIAGASDGAGSIRIPASCCGVFGLKPSRGRITSSPYAGDSLFGLAIGHALTRSVRDSAALLDVSSGSTPGDYWSAPSPARPFAEEVGADPGRLRIAVSNKHLTGAEVHPDCVAATERAAELLTRLGHRVEEGEPSFELSAMTHSMLDLWATGNLTAQLAIAGALERSLASDELEPTTWELIEHARRLTVADVVHARENLQAVAWRIAEFFERHDLWLTPTLAQPPLPLGELNRSFGTAAGWWEYDLAFNPWNPVANIAGCPSASLPLHWSPDGLPIGSLLTAGYAREATLIQVCAQLEAAQPWHGRAPAISARGKVAAGEPPEEVEEPTPRASQR